MRILNRSKVKSSLKARNVADRLVILYLLADRSLDAPIHRAHKTFGGKGSEANVWLGRQLKLMQGLRTQES